VGDTEYVGPWVGCFVVSVLGAAVGAAEGIVGTWLVISEVGTIVGGTLGLLVG